MPPVSWKAKLSKIPGIWVHQDIDRWFLTEKRYLLFTKGLN